MVTKYVYFLFANGNFFAKAFTEDYALEIFQTMKEIFPEGTFFEMKIYDLSEVKTNDK